MHARHRIPAEKATNRRLGHHETRSVALLGADCPLLIVGTDNWDDIKQEICMKNI